MSPLPQSPAAPQALYQAIADQSMVGIMVHHFHQPLYVNRAWAELHGYSVDEILAMDSILPLVEPSDRQRLKSYNKARLAGGDPPARYRYRALPRDGCPRWIEILTHRVDWEGTPAVQNNILDAEAQIRTEERLESLVVERTEALQISSAELSAEIEARRHTEAALDTFRSVVRASQDTVFLLDTTLCYIEASDRHLRSLGKNPSNVVGTAIANVVESTYWSILEGPLHRALCGGQTHFIEWIRDVSLGSRYLDFHCDPVRDAHGQIVAVMVTGRDITEIKLAEQELRVLESVVSQVNEQISLVDRSYIQRYTNWAKSPQYRVVPIGSHVKDLIGEDAFYRRVKAKLDACFEGERINYQYEAESPTGDTIAIDVTMAPFRENDGRISGAVVTLRDITEKAQAEKALRTSEQHFRSVVENARLGVVVRHRGKVLFMNAMVRKMLGVDHTTDIAQFSGVEDLAVPEDRDRVEQIGKRRDAKEFASPSVYTFQGQSVEGEHMLLQCYDQPITWDRKTAVKSVLVNVTDQDRMEKERRRLEEELRQAQKMQAIGQLTGGIAHDFNNLLTSVLGFSSLARMAANGTNQDKLLQYLDEVEKAGGRGRDLVLQMLTFARGGQSTPEVFDITQRSEDATKLLRSTLPTSVKISLDPPSAPVFVNIAPYELDQVLMNLCINARDAMQGRGMIDVSIAAEPFAGVCRSCGESFGGHWAKLSVSDDGPGVSDEILSLIFDPFFTTKPAGKGTGLGLSTVHGIIHRANGHLTVENTNPGLRVSLYFPLCEKASEPDLEDSRRTLPHASPGNARVFIVDDEPAIVRFLDELLSAQDFECVAETSSESLLKRIKAAPNDVDLLITDLTMPEPTGEQLVSAVRALRPDLPILVCSGDGAAAARSNWSSQEYVNFVAKPVAPTDLLTTVHELLKPSSFRN
ncbi:MAG: PAS domain S-box protein [Pseudomonadota bacterium]